MSFEEMKEPRRLFTNALIRFCNDYGNELLDNGHSESYSYRVMLPGVIQLLESMINQYKEMMNDLDSNSDIINEDMKLCILSLAKKVGIEL